MRHARTPRWILPALVVAGLALLVLGAARADEIDDAAARPGADGTRALEALLAEAGAASDGAARARRLRGLLAERYVVDGDLQAALVHLETLAREPGLAEARVRYGEVLLAVARAHIAEQAPGRQVMPYLRDALDAVDGLDLSVPPAQPTPPEPVPPLPPALRARLLLVVVEARYLLQEHAEALAALARGGVGDESGTSGLAAEAVGRLQDLRARCLYALGRYEESAAAFDRAGNPLGAAAAFDAARLPAQSMPIYADAIRRTPTDGALLERALAAARFAGAQEALLVRLEGVEVPAGLAGVPLSLARADLLEEAGRGLESLPLVREVTARDPGNVAAWVRVGRLVLLTGDPARQDVWDEAAAAYGAALKLDPAADGAFQGLAYIAGRDFGGLWRTWRDPRVVARCLAVQEAMVAAMPDDALSLANLANTLRVLGRHEESLERYARALEANPFDPAIESDRGLALSAAGRPDEALAAYERSVALDSGHLAGRQNAARSLWLAGRDDEAETHLGAAVRTTRAVGRSSGVYRFLLDRIWRTRRDPSLR